MSILENKLYIERMALKQKFMNHFCGYGLTVVDPEPLIPKHDRSVSFTGASINKFKADILSGAFRDPGCVIIQPCLRLFSLNKLLYPDQDFHLCYFNMLGTVFSANQQVSSMSWCLDYLKGIGIPEHLIMVKVSENDSLMADRFSQLCSVSLNCEDDSYYQWKFGMDGVVGRGATFAVWNEYHQKWKDIGNYIQIFKDGCLIGSEFSIGLETTQVHLNSLAHYIDGTTIEAVVSDFPGLEHWRIKDTISTLAAMYSSELLSSPFTLPPQNKQGSLARKALKNLAVLKGDYPTENIERYFNEFLLAEFGKSSYSDIEFGLSWAVQDIDKNTEKFVQYLNELHGKVASNCISKEVALDRALKKADGACSLPPFIRDSLLNTYLLSA